MFSLSRESHAHSTSLLQEMIEQVHANPWGFCPETRGTSTNHVFLQMENVHCQEFLGTLERCNGFDIWPVSLWGHWGGAVDLSCIHWVFGDTGEGQWICLVSTESLLFLSHLSWIVLLKLSLLYLVSQLFVLNVLAFFSPTIFVGRRQDNIIHT